MFLVAGEIIYDLIAITVTLLAGVVLYYKWIFTYWKRRGLEYLEPSIPFGNTTKLFAQKASFSEQFREFYQQLKQRGLRHGGVYMFTTPFYIPVDPFIIKEILQKDFSHFVDRGFYVNETNDPLSGHLFSLQGDKWRRLRSKLTAAFTSGKMKMMFETMASCAKELNAYVQKASNANESLNIKDVLARYTTDVISSCAFGLESNCLKNPDTAFRYFGKRVFENTKWENFKLFLQFFVHPKILDALKYKSSKPDVEEFILNIVKKTVDYREQNNVYRKDFLHLLLQLKNRGKLADDGSIFDSDSISKELGMTINEVAAQVFVFFLGGFETSATTLTFTLYELSLNQNVQDKLRREINAVLKKHNNEISYEAIMEMTYMDQVVNETLRKHPPAGRLNRICTKTYDVPGTNIRIEEGTMAVIPTLGLHHDPEFYPEPSKYDPERFSETNKKNRPSSTWLPFGDGPRICIGSRFGLLQVKMALTTLLKNKTVALNEKTKMPLVMDPTSVVTTSRNDIWLQFSELE